MKTVHYLLYSENIIQKAKARQLESYFNLNPSLFEIKDNWYSKSSQDVTAIPQTVLPNFNK